MAHISREDDRLMPLSFLGHIRAALADASRQRPLFHSEADFQLELAYALRTRFQQMSVRLEVPVSSLGLKSDKRQAVDLVLGLGGEVCLVELKYAKARAELEIGAERYSLPHATRDVARYGFLKDIARLESFAEMYPGIAVMLSNDCKLWTGQDKGLTDTQFRVHEGREVSGMLEWSEETSTQITAKNPPLNLIGSYRMNWHSYSTEPCNLRYTAVQVCPS